MPAPTGLAPPPSPEHSPTPPRLGARSGVADRTELPEELAWPPVVGRRDNELRVRGSEEEYSFVNNRESPAELWNESEEPHQQCHLIIINTVILIIILMGQMDQVGK